jgi:ketosteroid isomerase-like protein
MSDQGAAETAEQQVLLAVDAIIDNFAHHRRNAYFAGFDADATFVFHTSPSRLESREAYEQEWDRWEREDGFRVLSCVSTARRLQFVTDDIAIFTHDVQTRVAGADGPTDQHERETIVMRQGADGWLCIHEHLSGRDDVPAP